MAESESAGLNGLVKEWCCGGKANEWSAGTSNKSSG